MIFELPLADGIDAGRVSHSACDIEGIFEKDPPDLSGVTPPARSIRWHGITSASLASGPPR